MLLGFNNLCVTLYRSVTNKIFIALKVLGFVLKYDRFQEALFYCFHLKILMLKVIVIFLVNVFHLKQVINLFR